MTNNTCFYLCFLFSSPTAQHQTCKDGPSRDHEVLRRKIDNGVSEMWYYIKAELNKLKEVSSVDKVRERVSEMLVDAGHHQRYVCVMLTQILENVLTLIQFFERPIFSKEN